MNILHINSNFMTSKLHENLMDHLENKDRNNYIFMPIKFEKKEEFVFSSNHNVFSPIAFSDYHKYFFFWKQSKIIKELEGYYSLNTMDIVHAHTLFTDGNVAYYLYKNYNIPYIVTVRSDTDIENFFKMRVNLRKRGRKILREAKKIIFLSNSSINILLRDYINNEDLKKEILNKAEIIPNGIDPFWFENEGKSKSLDSNEEVKIITVGQVRKRKNQLNTIRAVKYFQDHYNIKASLTIVGKVVEESYYQEISKELEETDFNLIEFLPMQKLVELYRNQHIFILPSYRETFGLVYPEAMSQGLPVVYTNNQGFFSQFQEGDIGYGVDPEDLEDIAAKIKLIIDNYERMSSMSLNMYKKFDWKSLSGKVIELYNEVLS